MLAVNAQGLSLSHDLQTFRLDAGQVGVRLAHHGVFRARDGPRRSGARSPPWSAAAPRLCSTPWPPEVYEYERADVEAIIETAEVA